MKKMTFGLMLALSAGLAFAGNSNGCQGNCPATTTGGGTTSSNAASTATGVGVGVGVGVGYGGSGGSATGGTSSATGGSVTGSGNSTAFVSNSGNAHVATTVMQGQQQGQAQQQAAYGGAGGSASSTSSSSSGGNTLAASTGSMSVSVNGDTYQAQARNPVSSAWAAPLAASNGTCMGSTSAGAQGVTIGLSVGTTWTDENCNARYDAIAIKALGHERAAWARLCQQPAIRKAYEAAGTPCPEAPKGDQKAAAAGVPAHAAVYYN